MPVFSPTSHMLNTLVYNRSTINNISLIATNIYTNANGSNPFQVVCAWPVSGQYGPGSRVLYYVLVVACVLARKAEWLRNACLAAALLFPAVAACHGIVLAAVHVNGAVDMDIYGAFQLCSIGILTAPVTVKLSRTYFNNPGRNIIFLWTGLVLGGLLSLMVEFYRSNAQDCNDPRWTVSNISEFLNFEINNTTGNVCGLTCSIEDGPFSPLRGGSTNNIYVIPIPERLTFNTGTLLAAACCIPAILSLVSMWFKILEINWKQRFGNRDSDEESNESIHARNGATTKEIKKANSMIRLFLSALEVPVYGAAILAILILGERNFFSIQVRFETEPIASIGQWAPIVGTGFAALGSLYLFVAVTSVDVEEDVKDDAPKHHCNCQHHTFGGNTHPTFQIQPIEDSSRSSADSQSIHNEDIEIPHQDDRQELYPMTASSHSATFSSASSTNVKEETSDTIAPITTRPSLKQAAHESSASDIGSRRKVAKTLVKIGNYLGTAAHDQFDNSEFTHGKAQDFPEIPGEEHRNPELPQIRQQYNQTRNVETERPSRAPSFVGSVASGVEGISTIPRGASPQSPHRMMHASTLPVGRSSHELQNLSLSQSIGGPRNRPRNNTLEVPSPARHKFPRGAPPPTP